MAAISDNVPDELGRLKDRSNFVTALGLMSGTSMDGIDVAIIKTDGQTVSRRDAFATYPYAPELRTALQSVVGQNPSEFPIVPALVRDITDAHGEAVRDFIGRANISFAEIDVVGFHGQTVFHDPGNRITCQLGDGQRLADDLGVPVVSDFRTADVAAGGQGAPFAPLYHAALAEGFEKPVCVLNLGGVGNVTWLSPDGAIVAFDTGPANAMLDDWVRARTASDMDDGGRISRGGSVNEAALSSLMDDPYFSASYPKSLDRDHFDPSPIASLSVSDGAATLVAFTAESVLRAEDLLPARPLRWLVTGGGRHNPVLMASLRQRLACSVDPVEVAGWSGDALEAQAFAYLAVRSARGLSLSLPTTTGVPQPMTGGVVNLP